MGRGAACRAQNWRRGFVDEEAHMSEALSGSGLGRTLTRLLHLDQPTLIKISKEHQQVLFAETGFDVVFGKERISNNRSRYRRLDHLPDSRSNCVESIVLAVRQVEYEHFTIQIAGHVIGHRD